MFIKYLNILLYYSKILEKIAIKYINCEEFFISNCKNNIHN
jgi:hypothetical protein